MDDLGSLVTEQPNPASEGIDTKSTEEILRIMNREDARVPEAVRRAVGEIAALVDAVVERLRRGGRLFYVGAGTSGRLGVLDAAECPPTFGTDPEMVQGIIAGGREALTRSIEGAEDRAEDGAAAADERGVGARDVLVGITASGQAPFVIAAMRRARERGALVGAIGCNRESRIFAHADLRVFVDVGPEIVTGSTRMKSGTAQKLVLNMLSTATMIRLGKVYGNLMVDLRPVNAKLVARSRRIIRAATGCDDEAAERAFESSGRRPKTAIVMIFAGASREEAERLLERGEGRVGSALAAAGARPAPAPAAAAGAQPGAIPPPEAPPNPRLVKLPFAFASGMENTPVLRSGRPYLVDNHRPGGFEARGEDAYLFVTDLTTGREVSRFGAGHSFVSAVVEGNELHVFATEFRRFGRVIDTVRINRFSTTDLETWSRTPVLERDGAEQLFNTSVCRDDRGWLMAYESDVPVKWCFRFARSTDLVRWERVDGISFADVESGTACSNPAIRWIAPYYYVIYGIWAWKGPGASYRYALPETRYVTAVARSKDLARWELSPTRGPMLDPEPGEGINNTDADLFEYQGNTYLYYATGDQATWGTIRAAVYPGSMREMLEAHFPAGARAIVFDATKERYVYP